MIDYIIITSAIFWFTILVFWFVYSFINKSVNNKNLKKYLNLLILFAFILFVIILFDNYTQLFINNYK